MQKNILGWAIFRHILVPRAAVVLPSIFFLNGYVHLPLLWRQWDFGFSRFRLLHLH